MGDKVNLTHLQQNIIELIATIETSIERHNYCVSGTDNPYYGTRSAKSGVLGIIDSFKSQLPDDFHGDIDIFKLQVEALTPSGTAQMIDHTFKLQELASEMYFIAGCIRCYRNPDPDHRTEDNIVYDYMLVKSFTTKRPNYTRMIQAGSLSVVGMGVGIGLCFLGPLGIGVGISIALISLFTGVKICINAYNLHLEDVTRVMAKALTLLSLKNKGFVQLNIATSTAYAIFAGVSFDLPNGLSGTLEVTSIGDATTEELAQLEDLNRLQIEN